MMSKGGEDEPDPMEGADGDLEDQLVDEEEDEYDDDEEEEEEEEEEESGDDYEPGESGQKRGRAEKERKSVSLTWRPGADPKGVRVKKKKKDEAEAPHPASFPPADGSCPLLLMVNRDAQRVIVSHLDRLSMTQLSFSCKRLHEVITSSPQLNAALVPITAQPNQKCIYCRKKRRCNRSLTCSMGHTISVHRE